MKANASFWAWPDGFSTKIRNSSPPSRATSSSPATVAQPVGDGAQNTIPGLVAQAVVDVLEAVEIEEDDGHRSGNTTGPGGRLGEAPSELIPVGQSGQEVATDGCSRVTGHPGCERFGVDEPGNRTTDAPGPR